MKRLLLVSLGHGPTDIRVNTHAKYLQRHSWETRLITHRMPREEDAEAGRYADSREIFNPIPYAGRGEARANRACQAVFIQDAAAFSLPLLLAAARREASNCDAALISGGPFSQFLAAAKISRLLPTLLEYRDGWIENWAYHAPTRMHRAIDLKAQQAAMKAAKRIIVLSRYWENLFARTYPDARGKLVNLPNGYDPEDFTALTPPGDPGVMAWSWIGTMLPSYSLAVIRQLDRYCAANRDAAAEIRVRVAGRIAPGKYDELRSFTHVPVTILGRVSHRAAISQMRMSQALIHTTTVTAPPRFAYPPGEAYGWLTTRIFEYIASRVPILSTDSRGLTAEMIGQTRSGVVIPAEDENAIYRAVSRWHERWRNGLPLLPGEPDTTPIEKEFNRGEIAGRLAQTLDEVVARG